ncbi:MAG: glycosyl hydrolase family 28 protein [Capsulimonadaceae bacterium]|nr:glycosyl hydrolase family 28 protein [Capsulimonadaceae bacterium]
MLSKLRLLADFFVVVLLFASLQDARADALSGRVFNVVDSGAAPDGRTLDTDAIQKAVDACSQAGGGTVRVPAGTYLTGTINLRDNVTLSLDTGATLLGSTQIQDYRPRDVIRGKGVKNIAIVGDGTIDGQGYAFWSKKSSLSKHQQETINFARIHYWSHNEPNSGDLVLLSDCANVRFSGVTLQNSQSWTLHLLACANVVVEGIRIRNRLNGPNTDGIDVDGSQDVQIANCDICTGDDAVVLKNRSTAVHFPHACKNVTITRCKLISPTNGFKIGTESYGDFENIVFEDSTIQAGDPKDPWAAGAAAETSPQFYGDALGPEAGIAIESVDGSHIRGVTVRNIVMHDVQSPIFIRLGSRGVNPVDKSAKAPTGTIDDVKISDIVAERAWCPSIIAGVPGHPVRGIVISNVRVTNIGAGSTTYSPLGVPEREGAYPAPIMWSPLPAHSLYMRHAEGIKLSAYSVVNDRPDTRLAVIADDVSGMTLDGLTLDPLASSETAILFNNVRDSQIRGTVPRGVKTWVSVYGAGSGNITLVPSDPKLAGQVYALGDGVPASAATVRTGP